MFKGRKLLIATKHGKEKAIAPLLEHALGVHCEVISDFDTDQFGTFSGEVERTLSPVDTVRLKCLTAMQKYKIDLAVANEGSFGPHPSLFFMPADDEFIILIDKENNLEIIAREISTETNFSGEEITSIEQLNDFVTQVQFPTHGLIVKNKKENFSDVVKDIFDYDTLLKAFNSFKEKYGSVYIETDMRAHANPSRMKVIETVTQKLITKIQSTCPSCTKPGFDVTDAVTGLPCAYCGAPTRGILKLVYTCLHCNNQKEILYPNGNHTEDPSRCDFCNP